MLQIDKALFQLRAVDLRTFIQTGVLNRDGRRDRERFRQTQVLITESVRVRISKRQQAKHSLRSGERDAKPRMKLGVSLKLLPSFLLCSVSKQETAPRGQNSHERGVIGRVPGDLRFFSAMPIRLRATFPGEKETIIGLCKENPGRVA